ncbi:MAG: phosphopyruvate hydratase [Candidatus Kerfeldbacteria bacterium]|nr:phosphopyruvate hydratase [Candidatus Kerfeldbacteria bacterium]
MVIESLRSRQILDSRGHPTLETTVDLDIGLSATASVPSGASTGSHEAHELRDGDATQYQGLGVLKAVDHVMGPIAKVLKGHDVRHQRAIDQAMIDLDGTVNKSSLGANAMLSVSLAVARVRAMVEKAPLFRSLQEQFDFPAVTASTLPRPMMNIINGGRHADTGVKIQEYLIMPGGATTQEQIARGHDLYEALRTILLSAGLSTLVGDEGGFAPKLTADEQGLKFLVEAAEQVHLQMPGDLTLGLDIAASELYDPAHERYRFGTNEAGLSSVGMVGLLAEWLDRYPIVSLEDPLAEDDWDGWADLTAKLGARCQLVGDDLFTTNRARLEQGVARMAANAVLIKPNQIGTLTETVEAILYAYDHQLNVVMSHRSGETTDDFIVDLAVAVGAQYLKAGAPARGERVAKYNRLLAIEQVLRS